MASGWRSIAVVALLALPVWAALDGSHRIAYLPAIATEDGWAGLALEALAVEPVAAEQATLQAVPAPTPFPPLVARWRALVEAELQTIRTTRGLNEAITPELVLAVIAAESGGDPDARSHAHAAGLMQVLPTTFAALL